MNSSPSNPTKFDVHLYAVVRVKVSGVEAASHEAAVEQAINDTDVYACIPGPDTEFADEYSHFLVDVVGDEDNDESKWFYSLDQPSTSNLKRLVAWFDAGRDETELAQIIADAREIVTVSI